jgi:hypothetical protein
MVIGRLRLSDETNKAINAGSMSSFVDPTMNGPARNMQLELTGGLFRF